VLRKLALWELVEENPLLSEFTLSAVEGLTHLLGEPYARYKIRQPEIVNPKRAAIFCSCYASRCRELETTIKKNLEGLGYGT